MKHIFFYSNTDEYRELSNFWPAPFLLNRKEWPTSEHFYQAMKSEDNSERERIRRTRSPGEALRLGRSVQFLRKDWEQVVILPTYSWILRPMKELHIKELLQKDLVMLRALRAKFWTHNDLAEKLRSTRDAKLHENSRHSHFGYKLGGKDMLGKLLMIVRDNLLMRK